MVTPWITSPRADGTPVRVAPVAINAAPTASRTMTQARDIGGYPSRAMDNVISLIALVLYIVAILALSAAITWAVIRISPSESAKEQQAKEGGSKA